MFHDKTELLDDKQYYDEFNATWMDQLGAKLEKLWIY
jgi:hypothetical protein